MSSQYVAGFVTNRSWFIIGVHGKCELEHHLLTLVDGLAGRWGNVQAFVASIYKLSDSLAARGS
jgi:hypothetical protein